MSDVSFIPQNILLGKIRRDCALAGFFAATVEVVGALSFEIWWSGSNSRVIAEEVAEVNPALVACNSEGPAKSVHYEMVSALLLNEFLKEHRTVKDEGARRSKT